MFKKSKKFVAVFFVAFIAVGVVSVPVVHGWSNWIRVAMFVQVPGTSVNREATGQWRHRMTGVHCIGNVQSETQSNNARPVAIVGNSNGTWNWATNVGSTAHLSVFRTCSGNHSGWSLRTP